MPIPTLSPMSVVGDVDITGNYRRNGSLLSAADVSAVALSLYGAKGSLAVGLSASVAGQLAVGSNGQVLTADSAQSHGVKWATTVTSVSMTVPSILSVSGSPVTSVGTLAVSLATQSANTVFAGATSGGAATPAFRALVGADIPSLDAGKITTGVVAAARLGSGTANATTFLDGSSVWRLLSTSDIPSLDASKITGGTFSVGRGGTGNTSFSDYALVYYEPSFSRLDDLSQAVIASGTQASAISGVLSISSTTTSPTWRTATGWSGSNVPNRAPSGGMTLSQLTDVVRTLVFDLININVLHA